jgi:hypothetical protein
MTTPTDLEDRLRAHYADRTAHEPVRHPGRAPGAAGTRARFAIPRDRARLRGPRLALVATVAVVVLGTTVGVAAVVGNDARDPEIVTSDGSSRAGETTGSAGWSPLGADGPGSFLDGLFPTAVTTWGERLVVVGVAVDGDGRERAQTWVTDDGLTWTAGAVDPPVGCFQGIVARGPLLLVACHVESEVTASGLPRRFMIASTTDLEHWTMAPPGDAEGDNDRGLLAVSDTGTVATALVGADTDGINGGPITVWASDDLHSWQRLGGAETDGLFANSMPMGMSWFGEKLVVFGYASTQARAGIPESGYPAVWTWAPDSSWRRALLSGEGAIVRDVSEVADGFVAVGAARGQGMNDDPAAWFSPDLDTWERVAVPLGPPADSGPSSSSFLSLTPAHGGSVLGVGIMGSEAPEVPLAWESVDGRTWTLSDTAGPMITTVWNGRPVGFSTDSGDARLWVWNEP